MCRLLLMTFACLLALFGISGLWMMPKLIQQKIEQRMQLKIGTKTFERFTKVPIPITVKFYLFNVTNSEQVLAGLERPKFQEVGPFMFKQWRRREIVDFEDYNRRLRYREIKTFYPMYERPTNEIDKLDDKIGLASEKTTKDRHNSDDKNNNNNNNNHNIKPHNTNMNDNTSSHAQQKIDIQQLEQPFMLDPSSVNVTVINVPLLSVLTKLAQLEEGSLKRNLMAKVVGRLIKDGRDKILVTRPANQLLFDGYKVDFMESVRDLVSGTLGFNFESPLPKNMFGFFYMKNGTWNKRENGELTVFTGRNDSMNDFMLVDNWNDQKQLNVWPTNTEAGNRCNLIKGTDGSQFHPGTNKHQVLSIFSPMVCTSLYIKFKEDTTCRDIPLLRFTTPADLFGAPKKNPKNACYCTIQPDTQQTANNNKREPPEASSGGYSQENGATSRASRRITDRRCYLDGLMDLSLCQRGAPVAASSPHFYNADPMLAMAAGLKPNKELHETYLDIEPMTGAVFRAASRAQINAYVEQAALDVVDSSIIGAMAPMVAPLLWLEERAEIDEKSANEFKGQLLNLVQKAKRTFVYAIVIAILLALAVSIQYWYVACYLTGRETKPIKGKQSLNGVRKGRVAQINRRHQNRSRLRSNMQLSQVHSSTGDARKSNLLNASGRAPLLRELPESSSSDLIKDAVPAIAIGAVLGAASAGTSSSKTSRREQERWRQNQRHRTSGYLSKDVKGAMVADNDDGLSKQMLVGLVSAEWEPGAATTATNTTASSASGHSSQGARDEDDEQYSNENNVKNDEEADLMKLTTNSGGSL